MAQAISIDLSLSKKFKIRLQRLAETKRKTVEMLVHEAVEEYVDRQEKRDEFLRDTMESLEHYKRTGHHVTGEEMDEWLARIAAGEDVDPPEPHT
jgi:predicted transcriptional regulator